MSKEQSLLFSDAGLQLRTIVESIGEAIMVQDRNYRCVYANDQAAIQCGFSSAQELLSTSLEEVINKVELFSTDGKLFRTEDMTVRRVFAGEKTAEAIYRVREKTTGREYWSKTTTRPILDKNGNAAYAVTVFRDVTAEKEAETNAEFLAEVSTVFAASLDYKKTISSLGNLIVPKLADWYAVELVNDDGILVPVHTANVDVSKLSLATELRQKYPSDPNRTDRGAYKVLKTGQPELLEDIPSDLVLKSAVDETHYKMLESLNLRSLVIAPIKVREKVIGVMSVCHSDSGRRFHRKDVDLIMEVAYRAGLAIENARLYSAAQSSEERLQLALEGSHIGLWEWYVIEDKLFFSDRCLEIFGTSKEDFKGSFYQDFTKFIYPDDVKKVKYAVEKSVKERSLYSIEYRIIRGNMPNKIGWVHVRGQTYYDENGAPSKMVGTVIDISERKESEDVKRRMEQKVSQLQVISSLLSKAVTPAEIAEIVVSKGVEAVQADGGTIVIIEKDQETLRLLYTQGYKTQSKANWPTLTLSQKTPLADSIRAGQPVILNTLSEIERDYPGLSPTPEIESRVSIVSFPLIVHGKILGALGLTFNRTQEFRNTLIEYMRALADQAAQALDRARVYEEAQEERLKANKASQAKSLFLANMSHEIRTPMNAILGFSKLLREEKVSDLEQEEFLRRIETNGDHLLHLIDDILDLSRVEAGQMRIEKLPFSLREMVKDIYQSLQGLVTEKNIKTELTLGSNLPSMIVSDAVRIKQVLMNLVGNSAKFTQEGIIAIRVSADSSKQQIHFDIEDSGPGIPKAVQGELFKPFSQGDASITRKYGGTGLGLILSRRIAETLGGGLDLVKSEKDHGAIFRLTLPILEQASAPAHIPAKESSPELVSQKRLRILLAEDVADNQILVKLYLRDSNVDLEFAANGLEALQMATETKFDLILMDIQMPQMDGLAATRLIRSQGYKGPIIALTAHALQEEINNSLQAGCDGHLTKPISKNVLLEEINRFTHQNGKSQNRASLRT